MTLACYHIGNLWLSFVCSPLSKHVASRCSSQNLVIVGDAIDPPADIEDKDKDQVVRELHELYMQRLKALYDKYKDTYAPDRIKELEFVE